MDRELVLKLAPHKSIPLRVAVHTNNKNLVTTILWYSMYCTNKVTHRIEQSNTRN